MRKFLIITGLFCVLMLTACGHTLKQLGESVEGVCKLVPAMLKDAGEDAESVVDTTKKAVGEAVKDESEPKTP